MKLTRIYKKSMVFFVVTAVGGLLYAWQLHHPEGDTPIVEHHKHFPKARSPILEMNFDPKQKAFRKVRDLAKNACQSPVVNITYLKVHKTGSSTLSNIFNRYGYLRNLSFLLPTDTLCGRGYVWEMNSAVDVQRNSLGQPTDLHEVSDSRYNLFTLHTTYNRPVLDGLMLSGSQYVTSLRDPVGQFESSFMYYEFSLALPDELRNHHYKVEWLREWFSKPEYYSSRYEDIARRGSVRKSSEGYLFGHNSQMRDLGFDMRHQDDQSKVSEYIRQLDGEIDFVLLMEYFDESLLLLRKQFCWKIDDILYIPENERPQTMKSTSLPGDVVDAIQRWNSADQQLYLHFNRTFWRKIEDYGSSFASDLKKFRRLLKVVFKACIRKGVNKESYARVHYIKKKKGPDYCELLSMTKNDLMKKIREKQSMKHNL